MSRDNLTAHKASEYDQKVGQTIPFYEIIHGEVRQLIKAVNAASEKWLDTGCGTGRMVEAALAEFPRTQFLLADPAESMLSQARKRLAGIAKERVTILPPTESARLGSHIAAGTIDVVTAIQCHHYLHEEGRRKALLACFDLLRPGGLLVAFENVAPGTGEGVRIGLKRWKEFLVTEGRTEAEADKHLARYGTEFFPITVGQHRGLLEDVGFRVVELFWFSQMQGGFYGIK